MAKKTKKEKEKEERGEDRLRRIYRNVRRATIEEKKGKRRAKRKG